MVEITKSEAEWFQKKGYQYPEPLHKTHSGASSKRYLTENPKYLKMLEELRKSRIKGE